MKIVTELGKNEIKITKESQEIPEGYLGLFNDRGVLKILNEF